ncbi:hypothetical protein [Streptomyces yanii]|uniref:HEAT repeat domain-containing protein n=1 Tax=Streptomyces yanii TaxID=78510 RepID=A0ABV5R7Z3_9ACTN
MPCPAPDCASSHPDGIHFTAYGVESTAHVDIAAEIPERAGAFLRYAADPDPLVRRPAIEAVGLFLGDGDRAVRTPAHRLTAENGFVERLLIVRTMAGFPDRLPTTRSAVTAWLDALADHRDPRALPDLITALETCVDDWRALYGVGGYPQAADRLVPLLADGLRDIDPDRPVIGDLFDRTVSWAANPMHSQSGTVTRSWW